MTIRPFVLAICLAAIAALARPAAADSITLTGSTIPIRDCTITRVAAGRVVYVDAGDRRHELGFDRVGSIDFDDLPELADAEALLADGQREAGLMAQLRALIAAKDDMQQLWIRARLARLHDVRRECVQAAGHAAAAITLDPHPAWRALLPVSAMNEPGYAAALEALTLLRQARAAARVPELVPELDRMIALIAPIEERLRQQHGGEAPSPEETYSGYTKEQILRAADDAAPMPDAASSTEASPDDAPQVETDIDAAPAAPALPVTPQEARSDPNSPETIESLLDSGAFAEAAAMCERVAERPGNRDLARFLFQYGRALAGDGRAREAALMHARCAIHFEGTPFAARSMLELATIYRDVYRRPDTSKRLAERAIEAAEANDMNDVAAMARALISGLDGADAGGSTR